jgi:TRAP-type C4-dicarboxylate transport system permease small subunit
LRQLAHIAERTATVTAIAGGVLILAVAVLVTASVLGRWLFNQPIPADFEFVEMGVGIAVFAFLSYTQMRGGHIAVDTFTQRLPPRVNAAIDGVWALLLCAFLALFAWGLVSGAIEARHYGETLVQLPWPIWPVYALSAFLCALACISAGVSALVKFGAGR